MKRAGLIVFFLLLFSALPIAAQSGCGKDPLNPCGPLPWRAPSLNALASPTPYTPMPTVVITATPAPVTEQPINPTFTIYPTSTPYSLFATYTPSGAPILTEGYYEQDTAAITFYDSFFVTVEDVRASGGSHIIANREEGRLYFTFEGTTLTLYRITSPERNYTEICIDGPCQWVNNYSETEQWQQPVTFVVPEGIHSVQYRYINGSNETWDLDAIQVGTGGPSETQPAAMPTIDPGLLQTPVAQAEEAVATLMPLYDLQIPDASGQMYSMFELAETLGSSGGTVMGIAKGIQGLNLGSIGSVITWAITASGYAVLVYILTSTTPILLWIINTVMKLVDMVLSLLPW